MGEEEKSCKICFIPGRESSYARTRVLLKGMRAAGIEVFDCSHPTKSRIRYLHSFMRFLASKGESDIILVGFYGHFLMPLVKLFTRKKILFDSFVSTHLTMIVDRKQIKKESVAEKAADFIDWLSCKLADRVFAGTHREISYLVRNGNLDSSKFSRLLVGSDTDIMIPHPDLESDEFTVEFHGEFQTLHGVTYIVKAAGLLPDVKFKMIGKGYLLENCKEIAAQMNLKNIEFVGTVPYEKIPIYLANASISLGIFGDTEKTQIVIPHKAYEAMACMKPLITADTPAVRELLIHEENAYLCEAADPEALASAIKTLRDDEILRKKIAAGGHKTFQENCSPLILGKKVKEMALELVSDQ